MEKLLLDVMYELPSMENVEKVVVDEGTVAGTSKPMLIYSKIEKLADSA